MYYEFFKQNKRRIITTAAVIFTVVVVWSVWTFIDRYGKIPLVIAVVPSDTSVMVGNYKFGGGTHYLTPGDYQVSATKDGFVPTNRTITVTGDKQQNVLAISLVPQSSEAKKWAADHQADYTANEQYGSIEASSNGQYFANLHPITTKLPYIDPYYKISYYTNDDSSIALTISTPSPRYRFYAIAKLRSMGYDPADFTIDFKDFHNPLEDK